MRILVRTDVKTVGGWYGPVECVLSRPFYKMWGSDVARGLRDWSFYKKRYRRTFLLTFHMVGIASRIYISGCWPPSHPTRQIRHITSTPADTAPSWTSQSYMIAQMESNISTCDPNCSVFTNVPLRIRYIAALATYVLLPTYYLMSFHAPFTKKAKGLRLLN